MLKQSRPQADCPKGNETASVKKPGPLGPPSLKWFHEEASPQKKEQVVETTCESHEKTSIGNFNNSEEVAF